MGWYGWQGGWMGWMWIFWILIIAVVVWLALRAAPASRGAGEVRLAPEEILRERYARGEIDTEEFQRRLEVLRHGGGKAG